MSVGERDPHTGRFTTGHEWAGITELDTPVPTTVKFFYGLTFAISVLMWILLPAWPLGNFATSGILGVNQRQAVESDVNAAIGARAGWSDRIASMELDAIATDQDLLGIVERVGVRLFEDNCAVCHGRQGAGGPGFPDLTDEAWLWGGGLAEIHETLRVGINAQHDDTRTGQMLGFGKDEILSRADVLTLTGYVRHLSGAEQLSGEPLEAARNLYIENCVECHGEEGGGSTEFGAPSLTDGAWIYGGDRDAIYTTIFFGRQGHMPHWEGRLTPVQLKMLAVYVRRLGER